MVIFDCNGVLVDSEPLATAIVSQEFMRAGFPLTPDIVAHYFTGRRPADMFAEVEIAARRKLPTDFAATVASAILRRFRAELRATAHMTYALSWLRGPKCVASSSSLRPHPRQPGEHRPDPLLRALSVFGDDVANGKPAPDLFLHAAAKMHVQPADCIVVEDSPVGVAAGVAAGMTVIGFVGGSHAGPSARSSSARSRRPRRDLGHARAQEHDHRSARVVSQ